MEERGKSKKESERKKGKVSERKRNGKWEKEKGKNKKVTRRITTNDHFRIFCFYTFGTEQRGSERKKRKRKKKR